MNESIDLVSHSYEKFASSEGIDLIVNPLFSERLIDNILRLTCFVKSLDEFEKIAVAVKVSPHNLSIVGVVTATESLFTTIVEEGDSSGSESKSQSALEKTSISLRVKETRVIMIVDKNTESINISKILLVSGPSVSNNPH